MTVVAPNGVETLAGGSQRNITWLSANVANVRLEYTLDSGRRWALVTSSTAAPAELPVDAARDEYGRGPRARE